jgi:hypothetical protein
MKLRRQKKFKSRMASLTAGFLDYAFYVSLIVLAFYFFMFLVDFTLTMVDNEHLHEGQLLVEVQSTGIDVNVTSTKFTLDDPDLKEVSGILEFETDSWIHLLMSRGFYLLFLVMNIYMIDQLRQIFGSLIGGKALTAKNASRVSRVGFMVLILGVFDILVPYLQSWVFLSFIQTEGGILRPVFGAPANKTIIGLLILALGEVIRYGARVEEEQAGTV